MEQLVRWLTVIIDVVTAGTNSGKYLASYMLCRLNTGIETYECRITRRCQPVTALNVGPCWRSAQPLQTVDRAVERNCGSRGRVEIAPKLSRTWRPRHLHLVCIGMLDS